MLLHDDWAHLRLRLAKAANSPDLVPMAPRVLDTERDRVRWGWGGDRNGAMNRGLSVSGWKEAVDAEAAPGSALQVWLPPPLCRLSAHWPWAVLTTGRALSSTLYMDLLPRGT